MYRPATMATAPTKLEDKETNKKSDPSHPGDIQRRCSRRARSASGSGSSTGCCEAAGARRPPRTAGYRVERKQVQAWLDSRHHMWQKLLNRNRLPGVL
ncbi:hypothetical protein U9M48_014442 [Paspalum notatum var. saurae]|uniref:Uncharacterized protein n=1 Tax=Paspalum notatum var. saurae TaxID=547442 RepID=A0AAQ3WKI4_PASNO